MERASGTIMPKPDDLAIYTRIYLYRICQVKCIKCGRYVSVCGRYGQYCLVYVYKCKTEQVFVD